VRLQVPGAHNVRNALAACAVGHVLRIAPQAMARGLAEFEGATGRLQRKPARGGGVVIDDTYNANPDSVAAAISVLAATRGRRVLVLGDMGELGPGAAALHAEVGDFAKAAGIDALFALGTLSAHAVAAFGPNARHCSSVEELVDAIRGELGPNVTVLVKGSRFMRMERVVASLAASPAVNEGAEH
jgi:UDP-N-acetylmuramoyl-tripeptide--D-alanyl-D-alanine ligase